MSLEILRAKGALEPALRETARIIFQVLGEKPAQTPLTVGLCGGRSVVGLLQALREESLHQPRELMARVNFFMVDERIVPLSSPDSNFGGLHTSFFKHLIDEGVLSATQLHPFEACAENVSVRCTEYMRELSNFGGAFSVVVLGVGEDGHVAGLFPEHPVLKKSGRGFESFFDSPKPPAARMTASRDLVTSASLAVVLALGEAKREAWKAIQDDNVPESRCPAKMALGIKRCVVLTDLE